MPVLSQKALHSSSQEAMAYKTNPVWGVLTSLPVFLHGCAQLLTACCSFFCPLSGYRWEQMLQKWPTVCLRSHLSFVVGSWKRWADYSNAECHSGRGFSASWGSGEWCFTLQPSRTLHSFVFFSLGTELLFCCTTWPGFFSPLVSSVWDCAPLCCWQHTHLSGFLYMCLFQHFTVLTSWTWDGRI